MKMDFSEQLFAKFSGYRIFCGFSGGADSTAALLLARKYQSSAGFHLQAVHFNHHLRGSESDAEAQDAAAFAQQYDIPFQCVDLRIPPDSNLESAARAARLEAWKKILPREKGAVLLGHHADDRRENLIIRLCRGSNSGGLSSMRAVSEIEGVTFLRPLLQMTRKEIEEFLLSQGITLWARDSSNNSTHFLRNYLRNILLPGLAAHFPGALKGMDRSLEALECDADFINSIVDAIPQKKKNSIAFWQTQHNAVRIRLLRELTGTIPTYDLLTRINKELQTITPELRQIPVNQAQVIRLKNDTISSHSAFSEEPSAVFWKWREEPEKKWGSGIFTVSRAAAARCCAPDTAYFDGNQLPDVLEISSVRPGERMIPFGSRSPKKIKKLRTDRHIGAEEKMPVLRSCSGNVFWAVNIRNSALAAVSDSTEDIVKFEYKGDEKK